MSIAHAHPHDEIWGEHSAFADIFQIFPRAPGYINRVAQPPGGLVAQLPVKPVEPGGREIRIMI
jgi:hypothetical protein